MCIRDRREEATDGARCAVRFIVILSTAPTGAIYKRYVSDATSRAPGIADGRTVFVMSAFAVRIKAKFREDACFHLLQPRQQTHIGGTRGDISTCSDRSCRPP